MSLNDSMQIMLMPKRRHLTFNNLKDIVII
jgi:hypothetical protein